MPKALYLAHYGVKGMKWGVRNADTKRKYAGRSQKSILKDYDSNPVTSDTLSVYKQQGRTLNRVRVSDNTNGRIYSKNGKLVGMVNTEKHPDGDIWIQGLEVFGDNQGKGLGTALLDKAVKDLGATKLSVRKTNSAKRIYDKYGFEVFDEDDFMYYMKYDKKRGSHG